MACGKRVRAFARLRLVVCVLGFGIPWRGVYDWEEVR
jgi:hypothetical protein